MNGSLRCFWLGALLLLIPCLPVRAENPKVSLKVKDATFSQAMETLSAASGLKLELARRPQRPEEVADPLPPGLEARASFDWTDTRFATALRQLCTRYNLTPFKEGEAYSLVSGFRPKPLERHSLVQKDGLRLFVSGLRSRRVPAQNNRPRQDLLYVDISCEWPDGDAETISDVTNIRACDDQGNILKPDRTRGFPQRFYPDERAVSRCFQDVDPAAKRLKWLEGDVMYRPRLRRLRLEAPIGAKPTRTTHEDAVTEVRPLQAPPADGRNLLPAGSQMLVTRLTVHPPAGLKLNTDFFSTPQLVGASGAVYRSPSGGGQRFSKDGTGLTCETTTYFPRLPERVVKVLLSWAEEAPEQKLFTVRFTDLPIPPVEELKFPVRSPERPPVVSVENRSPFYQQGGGTLVLAVLADGKPAVAGVASLGLSAKEGDGWSAIRWIDLPVGAGGIARLTDVRPGTYRVSRSYRPDQKAPAGRPMGMPVEVRVETGKEVALPRLE